MEFTPHTITITITSSKFHFPNPTQNLIKKRLMIPSSSSPISQNPKTHKPLNPIQQNQTLKNPQIKSKETILPTMYDIRESSKSQKIDLKLQTLGPFFRISAISLETNGEVGRAEGLIRIGWKGEKILHLDSIKMKKQSVGIERSIFGIGLFIGAVAIRYGYDCGCKTAQLLAINDSPLYHSKLVRFYKRIGFKVVYEVTGASIGDTSHMLVWGGVGTRMDADVEELLLKWCTRFTPSTL